MTRRAGGFVAILSIWGVIFASWPLPLWRYILCLACVVTITAALTLAADS